MRDKRHPSLSWALVVGVLALLPFVTPGTYVTGVMCFVALYATLACGMAVLLEQAGLFSLAHPTFFGLGAYVAGMLAANEILPPWAGIIVAAIVVALIAYLIGAPLLRLRGYYLACATFGLLFIVEIVLAQSGSITGGHDGLMGIPPLSVFGFTLGGDLDYYFISWGLCLGCVWFFSNLMKSRVGRAVKALHDSEVAASSVGINVPRCKLHVFVLTAIMASLAGSIFCFYLQFTTPSMFGFPLLTELFTMIVIGGPATLHGPVLGSVVLIWLREAIHVYLKDVLPKLTAEVDAVFFGILIVAILIFMPEGLAGSLDRLAHFVRRHLGRSS
ncbi:MAG: branched-chain amino acid ABC transporter permease [Desulfomonile tiedjei]|uniref:Branched-chain amino acid ABC transporter permease n=1 Tax=Desulfomonile tiedjei TaxID=2358 RepID=A0A9D6V4I7_9BACT|nr:branched-chain amino acid ABC transporter permease [Desulfomonile tiedjei]